MDGQLHLWFSVAGASPLRLPDVRLVAERSRRDGLWEHTCCEAFIEFEGGYYEFNLSPSGDWAVYQFTGYRAGACSPEIAAPVVQAHRNGDLWQLQAFIDLSDLPLLRHEQPWRMGLSAVLETKDGEKTYWALAHPSDKPDFHHPDSFALVLPAPELP
ncbi:DOMON-like domain-containing protein [Brevundimonas sp.]|uniref:DOMON-like domain-containing protein n=1 Tax=Brevundimonas sp. TaxID=1871086 RepID=UPI0025BC890E|nr:DOMON-like domain-containing protein [Brevundimonas sp.]